jgi:DNA-binding NarL/FixJ family response regulator
MIAARVEQRSRLRCGPPRTTISGLLTAIASTQRRHTLAIMNTDAPAHAGRLEHALTANELAVLMCLAKGLTNRGAGAQLGLSAKTVANYSMMAAHKLGVRHRTAAVVLALQLGLLDLGTLRVVGAPGSLAPRE